MEGERRRESLENLADGGDSRVLAGRSSCIEGTDWTVGSPSDKPDQGSALDLVARAYDTLHNLAAHYLNSERANHTLQPTALVHEAYVKLAAAAGASDFQSKTHFQAVASSAMRQILVDYARQRGAQKRGGNWLRVTLRTDVALDHGLDIDLLALDDALCELAALDERKSRVVELRFFGGLSCKEVAQTLDVTTRTVEADWFMARAWLQKKMGESE